jgi:hypothetical protein
MELIKRVALVSKQQLKSPGREVLQSRALGRSEIMIQELA